jgi:hypothetical protein
MRRPPPVGRRQSLSKGHGTNNRCKEVAKCWFAAEPAVLGLRLSDQHSSEDQPVSPDDERDRAQGSKPFDKWVDHSIGASPDADDGSTCPPSAANLRDSE